MVSQVSGLTNLLAQNALQQQKLHQSALGISNEQLASGLKNNTAAENPADQSIAEGLTSLIKVLKQGATNAANLGSVIQVATGAIKNMQNVLSTMNALAAKANADDIDTTARSQVNGEYTTLRDFITTIANRTQWNGVALLTGGSGAVTNAGAVTQAANNLTAVANGFAATLGATSQGMITGTAVAANVTDAGGGAYNYSLTIQDGDNTQTFNANNITPAAAGALTLVSTSNSANQIVLNFDGTAVTAITDVATAQSTFDELLGLDAGAAATASFVSLSTAANNGVGTIGVATTVAPGTYSLSKIAGATNDLVIQDSAGNTYTATASTDGAQTISFTNGMSVALGEGYAAATAITQMVFDVAEGTSITLTSQTGSSADETSSAVFAGATGEALNIANTDVSTKTNAASASNAISAAISSLSQLYATLGAQQTNLEAIQENINITTENLNAALSGYKDADIAEAVANSAVASAMVDVSGIAITKALMESQRAAKIANAV